MQQGFFNFNTEQTNQPQKEVQQPKQESQNTEAKTLDLANDENFDKTLLEMDKISKTNNKKNKVKDSKISKTNTTKAKIPVGTIVKIYGDELFVTDKEYEEKEIKEILIKDFKYTELAEGNILYDKVNYNNTLILNISKSFQKNG